MEQGAGEEGVGIDLDGRAILGSRKPEPFIQYGTFLLEQKGDALGAIEQYRQALIWKSDDEATRLLGHGRALVEPGLPRRG